MKPVATLKSIVNLHRIVRLVKVFSPRHSKHSRFPPGSRQDARLVAKIVRVNDGSSGRCTAFLDSCGSVRLVSIHVDVKRIFLGRSPSEGMATVLDGNLKSIVLCEFDSGHDISHSSWKEDLTGQVVVSLSGNQKTADTKEWWIGVPFREDSNSFRHGHVHGFVSGYRIALYKATEELTGTKSRRFVDEIVHGSIFWYRIVTEFGITLSIKVVGIGIHQCVLSHQIVFQVIPRDIQKRSLRRGGMDCTGQCRNHKNGTAASSTDTENCFHCDKRLACCCWL
mmetsp:Transcript_1794/g.2799  ORF Transcript_1794/g.2799 Transcript_1794/m.2799 type:complete len:281 (-) Transcript_1794:209-1051(-)